MEFRQLHYFITVVENKSFTKAAHALHISQPSLSTSIKTLESNLGITLLERSTRHMTLTREGEILYEESKKLMTHFDHIKHEMNRLKKEGPLELTIGLIESSEFWMPNVLSQFKAEFSNVQIQLLEVLSLRDVQQSLNNFHIHLAITNQYINDDSIQILPIYEESLVALLPKNHPLKDEPYVSINDLAQDDFIITKEGFQTRSDILSAFQREGKQPNIQFEIERFETACALVEDGLGITVVPEHYVRYSKKRSYHIKPIDDASVSRTVYLAFVKNRYLPPIVKRFITTVQEFFKDEDKF